jgi:hypothetical protein
MSRETYHIEFVDVMSGEPHVYDTSSDFLAEKMVRNVISFASRSKFPLRETKLKVIKYKKDHMHCCVTIDDLENYMFIVDLYYN